MQSTLENPVSSKFSDLLHSLKYVADDLKIACAEASLEGDFTRVVKLSDSSGQIQAFINDVSELSNRWNKGVLHPTIPRKTLAKSRKHIVGKKPRSKLLITINGQQIQHDTAANTFVTALEMLGIDRVASLNKKLSGIPLISKTPPTGYQSTKQSGPWFISTHSSTRYMKQLLEEIGERLKVPLQVKILEGQS